MLSPIQTPWLFDLIPVGSAENAGKSYMLDHTQRSCNDWPTNHLAQIMSSSDVTYDVIFQDRDVTLLRMLKDPLNYTVLNFYNHTTIDNCPVVCATHLLR